MRYKKYPASGGENFDIEDLEYMQTALQDAVKGIVSAFGLQNTTPYILSGVEDNGTTVSDGWIIRNGELLRFKSSNSNATVVIRDEEVETGQGDWEKWCECGTGVTTFNFASLVRLPRLYAINQDSNTMSIDYVGSSGSVAVTYAKYGRSTKVLSIQAEYDVSVSVGTSNHQVQIGFASETILSQSYIPVWCNPNGVSTFGFAKIVGSTPLRIEYQGAIPTGTTKFRINTSIPL